MFGRDVRSAHDDGSFDDATTAQAATAAFRAMVEHTLGPHLQTLRGMGDVDAAALRDAIRTVCGAAHTLSLPPERVIIHVKEVWLDLPPSRDKFRTGGTSELLDRVITMALDEYYRPPDTPA